MAAWTAKAVDFPAQFRGLVRPTENLGYGPKQVSYQKHEFTYKGENEIKFFGC